MLSKKTFVEAMNAIIKHKEIMDELIGPLSVMLLSWFSTYLTIVSSTIFSCFPFLQKQPNYRQ